MSTRDRIRALGGVIFLYFAQSVFAVSLIVIFRDREIARWASLVAAVLATALTITLFDRDRLDLWLDSAGSKMLRDLFSGAGWAVLLAVSADLLAQLGNLRHGFSGRVNLDEVGRLFIPAAVEEELIFRGYAFQKLLTINRPVAVVGLSALFTVVHLGNAGLTAVAVVNVFLAGVVLSLALIWRKSLWFVIAAHLSWNLTIGPLLGHEVSGYRPAGTLLTTIDRGPELVTGGSFGVEGSLCVTALGIALTALLMWRISQNQRQSRSVVEVQ